MTGEAFPERRSAAPQAGLLLLVTMAFVAVFQWARFPAALLLGPMLAAVLLAVNGARLQVPDWVFQIGAVRWLDAGSGARLELETRRALLGHKNGDIATPFAAINA